MKFKEGKPDKEFQPGPGTRVFVHGKSRSLKTQPVVLRQITSSRLLAQGSPFVRPVSRQKTGLVRKDITVSITTPCVVK
ncbi:Hypothetical predicted protein [Lynx pardinus]|uniref:Uncharacterized protein n=1 Tax=Lynx pardinus TaxID=191816 RepID=A0A485NBH7_LYNPA|nr:Hypothetical predicted protein [Lynx pardinus]